ncbi:MAG: ACT domain-containing protein [Candidatus Woesearchaeota archaeon]
MVTTTELTWQYISEHPSIKDCLKKGVVNYSKLARMIAKELGIEKKTNMEAILIACRRYALKLGEEIQEDAVVRILKGSELEIKNRIVVAVVDKQIYADNLIAIEKKIRAKADTFYAIEGTNSYTIIITEKYLDDLKQMFKRSIMIVEKNQVMIIIKSHEAVETTPGFVAYLYSLFGEHGINIVQTMSCWTDTIVIIKEADLSKVMGFLRF